MQPNGKYTDEAFKIYMEKHPQIYRLFIKYAFQIAQKRKYYSAKAIFHRIRWESAVSGADEENEFKISDGCISHYARQFMKDYPQYRNFFKTRNRRVTYHD